MIDRGSFYLDSDSNASVDGGMLRLHQDGGGRGSPKEPGIFTKTQAGQLLQPKTPQKESVAFEYWIGLNLSHNRSSNCNKTCVIGGSLLQSSANSQPKDFS